MQFCIHPLSLQAFFYGKSYFFVHDVYFLHNIPFFFKRDVRIKKYFILFLCLYIEISHRNKNEILYF